MPRHLRRRALIAVPAVLAVLVPALGVAPTAQAAGEALNGVAVTPAVSVDGLGSTDVAITADLSLGAATVACAGQSARFSGRPWARLTRTVGATGVAADDVVDVPLLSPPGGDPAALAGIWNGTWKPASSRNGTWTVTAVSACTAAAPTGWSVDPRAQGIDASVVVTGTGAPRLALTVTPVVYGARSTVARAVLRGAAGVPLAGQGILFARGATCASDDGPGVLRTTDATGAATAVVDPRSAMCVYVTTPSATTLRLDVQQALVLRRTVLPRYYFRGVSALPVVPAVVRGKAVTVQGTLVPKASLIGPGTRHRVALQIRSGRGWRTVATAYVPPNGRYTVSARATTRGLTTYRVMAMSNRVMLPTVSRSLLVFVI